MILAGVLGCGGPGVEPGPKSEPTPQASEIDPAARAVAALIAKHGEAARARIETGVRQVAALWRPEDGDLEAFAVDQFLADEPSRKATLARLEHELEATFGHLHEIQRELRYPTDVDIGPLLPVDGLLAAFDPAAHLTEDLFANKIAFVALLNFPLRALADELAHGKDLSRDEWAASRLTELFARRVPAAVAVAVAKAGAAADQYIADYNLWMHHVLSEKGERLFPKGMRLISHWNLRDELRAQYAEKGGAAKQRLIAAVMERIVTQTIPKAVINNPRLDWEPSGNRVTPAPADTVEDNAPKLQAVAGADPEPDTRYEHWRQQFLAARLADPFSPSVPTTIARSFELERRIPEVQVKAMLVEILTAPAAKEVAALVAADLRAHQDRGLEPFDLWYVGFRPRAAFSESELSRRTKEKYKTAAAFAADIPRILSALGFARDRAEFVASHIVVDPSRGAGHALEARRKGDLPHLRTRVGADGMDYKGYNIAVHELGHNVEQVFSLYQVDHTLLAGVPNNAFTEAIAFLFQERDLELLGLKGQAAAARRMQTLDTYWMCFEIAGVALLDLAVWHWLYDHPEATAAELRAEVVATARDIWNQYYAPVFGVKDVPILAIYSHLVAYPLYVADYALGHLVAFQIGEHLGKAKSFGAEIERMTSQGAVTPDLWMQGATGTSVSARALIEATLAAAKRP